MSTVPRSSGTEQRHVSQAEQMVKRSRVDFKHGQPGDDVAVAIPLVDHGRGNPRNILGVIVHRDLETDIYKTAGKGWGLEWRALKKSVCVPPKTAS